MNERGLDIEILFLRMLDFAMIVRIVAGVHVRIVREPLVLVGASVGVSVVAAARMRVSMIVVLVVIVESVMRLLVRFLVLLLAAAVRVAVIVATAQTVRVTVAALHCNTHKPSDSTVTNESPESNAVSNCACFVVVVLVVH